MSAAEHQLQGMLHIFVAFDWGEEVDLARAGRLAGGKLLTLARRPRTPSSLAYRPTPWQFPLGEVPLDLAVLGQVAVSAEATVFDFGAVSVALHVPLALSMSALAQLAGSLSDSARIVQAARTAVKPLYEALLPAIEQPEWSQLDEEYFVFHFPALPDSASPTAPANLLGPWGAWTAGIVQLEAGPLSEDEQREALRLRISYSPSDLFVPEWSAALLVDSDCEDTLQIVEYANMQLLEYRHIDDRLDDRLAGAYRLIHPLARGWLPFWRMHGRQLRAWASCGSKCTTCSSGRATC